jgi:2-keto-myo-inositol isomerase
MKPCISQTTTLMNPFEADAAAYRGGGWTAVELWLTKLESFVQGRSVAEARSVLESHGVRPVAAAGQGGLLLSRGEERAVHWDHFRRRLALLGELGVPILIVAADPAHGWPVTAEDLSRAAASLGEAAAVAATFGIRLALEFQKSSALCACLETALVLVSQCGSQNAGVCLDAFHFHTGPSKLEDLDHVSSRDLAWVQLSDVSGTPRELAGDGDRILPGDGDFPLGPIVERLAKTGYDGYVSLELLNPHLWQVSADRVADLGYQALLRVLGPRILDPSDAGPSQGADAEIEGGY